VTALASRIVVMLREAEELHRSVGKFDTADATRQTADAIERDGHEALSCCAPYRGNSERIDAEIGWRP